MPAPLEPWADQRTPALAIVARGDQIETRSPREHLVRSQSRPGLQYLVHVRRERWTCTCAFHRGTGRWCIHIHAVRFRDGLREQDGAGTSGRECPTCASVETIHFGKRRTQTAVVSRFLCRRCGHRFTGREGFLRRRSDPRTIAIAVDLYFRGLSVRQVADHLGQAHGLAVAPSTVYAWVAEGSRRAARWMDSLGPRTGEKWHVDETVVFTDGHPQYAWNVLDADSRYLLATQVSHLRRLVDARRLIRRAKTVTPDRPLEVFTDGMRSYRYAIGRELGFRSGSEVVNPHRRVPSIRARLSNNLVERLHGTEKARFKTMRGFDTRRGAKTLLEGFRVHYNLVRAHESLGTTPGEAAGLPDVGGFRWQGILAEATRPAPRRSAEIELIASSSSGHRPRLGRRASREGGRPNDAAPPT